MLYRREPTEVYHEYQKNIMAPFFTLIPSLSTVLTFDVGLAQTGGYADWHMGTGMMGQWGYGWFGGIFMIVFWIVVLAALIFLIRWLMQSGDQHKSAGSGADRAIEILRERYARGEINKEEFQNKTKDLK